MRLLLVSPTFPLPPNNGCRMRIWAILRALAAEGHEVTLITFAEPGEEIASSELLRQVCTGWQVVPFTLPRLSGAVASMSRLAVLSSTLPYAVSRFRSASMRLEIQSALDRGSLDAVICETPYPLVNFPGHLPCPLILDCQNIEHLLLRRYAAVERNPAKRLYARLESAKLSRWERMALSQATLTMACSKTDLAVLARLCPGTSLHVVPNVVDVDAYEPTTEGNPATVLYLGGMDWQPNRDAVEFFAIEILPELKRLMPEARFIVAGRNPSDQFRRRFAHLPEVEFTGTVPDIRPVVARASVCVVPLRIGSGTRLKILEAAAMAKPVVSTTLGAEGLEFADGREILIADDPVSFARAVAGLLTDPPRRRRIGHAARRRASEAYSLQALQTTLREPLKACGPRLDDAGRHLGPPLPLKEVGS